MSSSHRLHGFGCNRLHSFLSLSVSHGQEYPRLLPLWRSCQSNFRMGPSATASGDVPRQCISLRKRREQVPVTRRDMRFVTCVIPLSDEIAQAHTVLSYDKRIKARASVELVVICHRHEFGSTRARSYFTPRVLQTGYMRNWNISESRRNAHAALNQGESTYRGGRKRPGSSTCRCDSCGSQGFKLVVR